MKKLVMTVRNGYKLFQGGKFNDSKATFSSLFAMIPLVVTETKNEASEIKEMLTIAREYVTAIRLKGAMAENASDPARATELAAYFTHCNLQPMHLLLALRSAMGTSFKHKNFIAAAGFARRLLELPDMSSERNKDLRVKATRVLQRSEQMARNEHTLNYDESKTFSIDARDFVPIYPGDSYVESSYCGSRYKDEAMRNTVCLTTGIALVGVNTIGLVTASKN
jgi:coatomer protein complex subunit alpha (xenin)